MNPPAVSIEPYAAIAGSPSAIRALDGIFFASSNTQSFSDAAARAAFRERWLGRYLANDPRSCFVALTPAGDLIGYICGSLRDPANDPLFADQRHFARFASLTAVYPAQLHINLAETARGQGIGRQLISTFIAHVAAAGIAGVHAISSRGARNLSFYAANGFPEVGSATIGEKELVFLGRKLG